MKLNKHRRGFNAFKKIKEKAAKEWEKWSDSDSSFDASASDASSDVVSDEYDISNSDADDKDKYEIFEEWLEDNGARFQDLEIREYDDPQAEKKGKDSNCRGVHARKSIPKATVCATIPIECLITAIMGKEECPIGKKLRNSSVHISDSVYLAIYVLWDRKNPHSFHAPYYKVMPQNLDNFPIAWSEQELAKHLEGSTVLDIIAERKQSFSREYNEICAALPEFPERCGSYDDFLWAIMQVTSRNFCLTIDGSMTNVLIPYVDMLNHKLPEETAWTFDSSRQAVTLTTLQKLPMGSQIFDSYGVKSNQRYFCNYGFSVETDNMDQNEVSIVLPKSGKHTLTVNTWSANSLFNKLRQESRSSSSKKKKGYDDAYYGSSQPESIASERKAVRFMMYTIAQRLNEFPTTLKQDRKDLKDLKKYPLYGNARNAKIQVKGEKEILYYYVSWARVALACLDAIQQEDNAGYKELLKDMQLHELPNEVQVYCNDTLGALRTTKKKKTPSSRPWESPHTDSTANSTNSFVSNSVYSDWDNESISSTYDDESISMASSYRQPKRVERSTRKQRSSRRF